MSKRVVITGLGVVSPIGNNLDDFWQSIKNGRCGIDFITAFDATDYSVKLAAEVKNLDTDIYFSKRDIKHNSKFMIYARIAAVQAYAQSGLATATFDHDRFGVYVSSSIGGIDNQDESYKKLLNEGPSRVSPYLIPTTLVNIASGAIAIDLQARGSNMAIVTACASGANAIGEAYHKIRNGAEDVILAGGSEAAIMPLSIAGFASMRAMHTGNDPNRACIPFDAERSGTIMGEGAGIIVLEELEHALARGAQIFSEIIGYGTNCDAFSITSPEQEGITIGKAITKAINDAAIDASQIDYINAHGTSTVLNDKTESLAIKRVFNGALTNTPMSSTKSMTGHMLGASGAIEAIVSIKALQDSFMPATINYKKPDPNCDANLVVNKGIHKDIQIALSNSFGFGGHNACLVFKRWDTNGNDTKK